MASMNSCSLHMESKQQQWTLLTSLILLISEKALNHDIQQIWGLSNTQQAESCFVKLCTHEWAPWKPTDMDSVSLSCKAYLYNI